MYFMFVQETIEMWDDETHRGSFVVRQIKACAEFWTLALSKKQETPETETFVRMMKIIDDWQRAGKFRREILNGSEPL